MNAVTVSPWDLTPDERKEQSKQLLMEDLKAGHPRAATEELWQLAGVHIPTVDTMEEVERLALQGLPSAMMVGLFRHFGPELMYEQLAQIETEFKIDWHVAAAQREEMARRAPNRLKSVADMLKTPEITWLVEDKIQASGLTQIYGPSYAGKTLLVLDLIMSWCAGLPDWQGYKLCNDGKTQQAAYIAAEGGAAVSIHVDAWLKYHPEVSPEQLSGLVFLDGGEGHNLFLSVGRNEVAGEDSFYRFREEIAERGLAPSLVVFDTQIDLAPGIDENSNTDMVDILRQVKRFGDTHGFMALVIHHTGHDATRARGASGQKGKCDSMASLSPIGTNTGKARLEWTKVKGRAIPKDSISYEIKGWEKLPGLDSEGAVCVPLSKLETAIAQQDSSRPDDDTQRAIMNLLVSGKLSKRAIAESLGLNRDDKSLVSALAWMKDANLVELEGNGRNTGYVLAPLAVAPSEY